jgi:hypothetical protein
MQDDTFNSLYFRALPRALFNESTLKKCMGRLTLLIHDRMAPAGLKFDYESEPFDVGQWEGEGSLSIGNISIYIGDHKLLLKSPLNSRERYPLVCFFNDEEYVVFDDDGEFTEEFKNMCSELSGVQPEPSKPVHKKYNRVSFLDIESNDIPEPTREIIQQHLVAYKDTNDLMGENLYIIDDAESLLLELEPDISEPVLSDIRHLQKICMDQDASYIRIIQNRCHATDN